MADTATNASLKNPILSVKIPLYSYVVKIMLLKSRCLKDEDKYMSDYILKNIPIRFINQTKTNPELYKVDVPLPSYLKSRYRDCKYGDILVYKSCITDSAEPFCNDIWLARDSYSMHLFSQGRNIHEEISAEDIFREYQVFLESNRLIITDDDFEEERYLHDVPQWLLSKEHKTDEYRLLLSIPERLLNESSDHNAFTKGSVVFHKEQIKNIRDGKDGVTDILLKFPTYVFSTQGDNTPHMYTITRQEVIDTFAHDQKRRKDRKEGYQEQMAIFADQYKDGDYLELRHLFAKNMNTLDEVRCVVTLPVPASLKDNSSKWFCTLILPSEHVLPEPEISGTSLITVRLYAPEYEVTYPVTDTELHKSGRHTSWEKAVVSREELYEAHQRTLKTFDFYVKNGLT